LQYKNEQATGTTSFTVSFDAPLNDVNVVDAGKDSTAKSQPKPIISGSASGATPGAPVLQSYSFETASVDSKGQISNRRKSQARYYKEEIGDAGIEMAQIPGGSFTMGSYGIYEARPRHQVTVPEFYLGKYEVTQAQWRAVAALPRILRQLN